MEAFLVSLTSTALAEIGDKTQFLALLFVTRFHRPGVLLFGIFVAVLCNNLLAAAVGGWITHIVGGVVLQWMLSTTFLAIAVWTLLSGDTEVADAAIERYGLLPTTIATFLLADLGDKTQLATVALTAHYHSAATVVVATTLGAMTTAIPTVVFGDRMTQYLPLKTVRRVTALVFAGMAITLLLHR